MSIIDHINKGEGKKKEFKEIIPLSEKISKTVVAFANMSGGRIIIGVNDKGELIGISSIDLTNQIDRINILHDTIYPMIIPEIYTYTIRKKLLLIIEVYHSQQRPHFLKNLGKVEGTYIRVASTNKKANFKYIQELERQKRNITFDEDIWEDKTYDTSSLIKMLSINLNKSIDTKDLVNLKLIKKDSSKIEYTNAIPIVQGYLEYARIKCARFKGKTMGMFIDQKEYGDNIFEQLDNTMKFLLSHINLCGQLGKDYITRIDEYEIPPEALREAIVNAIIHRDYSISGSDIKVAIFDDRIEITSPGGFPKGITLEDVLSGRSEIRNRVIVRTLKKLIKLSNGEVEF